MAHLVEAWVSLYANHPALRTAIAFMHVGGLLAAGGCAMAADVTTLAASNDTLLTRTAQLQILRRTHGIAVAGLVALSISGALLFAADVETFLYSRVFWLKMGLLAALVANGVLFRRREDRVATDGERTWRRLRPVALASLALWLLTTLAGSALPNIG